MTDIKINSDRYVYFNQDGEITKITNYKDLSQESLKVSFSDVETIVSGAEPSLNFLVLYDKKEKKHVLRKKIFSKNSNLKSFIYELTTDELNPEVTIIQDLKNKKWKISLSSELKKLLSSDNPNAMLFFSVTKKKNPNLLYRVLRVKISDLLTRDKILKFQDQEECSTDISIYTVKQMNSYKYEVINGQI